MKHVNEVYQQLHDAGKVTGICRYNLRKFTRSFGLPPCGVSFWRLDDLNWDYLASLNHLLGQDKFRFRGGEHFPRSFWDHVMMGQSERTEYIFLTTGDEHHLMWRTFFARHFTGERRVFGQDTETHLPACGQSPAALFKNGLMSDLMHFADCGDRLMVLADFYLALYFMARIEVAAPVNRDGVFQAARQAFAAHRGDLSRILTTTDPLERLDDVLYLLERLEGENPAG